MKKILAEVGNFKSGGMIIISKVRFSDDKVIIEKNAKKLQDMEEELDTHVACHPHY